MSANSHRDVQDIVLTAGLNGDVLAAVRIVQNFDFPAPAEEHLPARAEREAEPGDHRRALQPATGRGGGDDVPPPVDDVEMAGVAAGGAVVEAAIDVGQGDGEAVAEPLSDPVAAGPVKRQDRLPSAGVQLDRDEVR